MSGVGVAVEVAVTTDVAPVAAAVTVAAETVSGPTSASASDSGAANPIQFDYHHNLIRLDMK